MIIKYTLEEGIIFKTMGNIYCCSVHYHYSDKSNYKCLGTDINAKCCLCFLKRKTSIDITSLSRKIFYVGCYDISRNQPFIFNFGVRIYDDFKYQMADMHNDGFENIYWTIKYYSGNYNQNFDLISLSHVDLIERNNIDYNSYISEIDKTINNAINSVKVFNKNNIPSELKLRMLL